MHQRIAAAALRIIKTPDGDSKGRVEPEDGPSSLSEIVPLGRIPNGTILHRRRAATRTSATEPANASFRQGRPAQSHDSSLGPEHPQSAIRPACRENSPLTLSGGLPRPQRSGSQGRLGGCGPRRGGQGERSPPPPLGTPPAACPLKRRGAVARDAQLRAARATSPQNSGRYRLSAGNSVGMPALAGLRESGAPRRFPGISADKPSKEALHRRPIGELRQRPRSVARLRRSSCQNGGLASANRGEHAAR